MKINEVAKLTGVTVRTLHYYDEIGLLSPSTVTKSGYRVYDTTALETLQQILFFRELDFPLSEIKEIMSNTHYDKTKALVKHKELLTQKRNRLDGLIVLVNSTLEGDSTMSFKEFDMSEIEATKEKYAAEVLERWGDTDAFKQSAEKTTGHNKTQWEQLTKSSNEILKSFGEIRHLQPDNTEAQKLVQRWQSHINDSFYTCTDEILSSLGEMYIADDRFKQNIDKNGEGTAEFLAKAIAVYTK